MVKECEKGEVEGFGVMEVAGMARVVQLHHRVVGQVVELLQ